MRAWIWLVFAVGCGFAPRATNSPSDAIDAPADEMPDSSCRSTCSDAATLLECSTNTPITCPLGCHVDSVAGDRCGWPVPSNGATVGDLGPHDLVISHDSTMDTTTGAIVEDASAIVVRTGGTGISSEGFAYTALGTDRGVLGVRSLVIEPGVTLRVGGSLVLIVLAGSDITIEGTLDASGGLVRCGLATVNQCGGPGGGEGGALDANGTGCSPGKPGFDGTGDETGGGGGGYGNPGGGNGGTGNNAGGVGGTGNCSTTQLVPIAGGSGGGGGGGGGAGGGGGGAVQLTALGHVLVHTNGAMLASVRANGAGGKAGPSGQGGGGGGSAGGILLEGQTVVIDHALLVANAGSGGAGDGGSDGNPGRLDVMPAPGGTGGKPGGQGAAKQGTPGNGTGPGDGTGGGGGSIGRIFINAGDMQYMVINGSIVSPTEYHAIAQSM